jgi:hypothetical protein
MNGLFVDTFSIVCENKKVSYIIKQNALHPRIETQLHKLAMQLKHLRTEATLIIQIPLQVLRVRDHVVVERVLFRHKSVRHGLDVSETPFRNTCGNCVHGALTEEAHHGLNNAKQT